MMDELAKKASVLELSNNPDTATAAQPAPLPITLLAAAAHSSLSRPIEIEETVLRQVESRLCHVPALLSDMSPGLSSSNDEPVPKRRKQLKSDRDYSSKRPHYLAP